MDTKTCTRPEWDAYKTERDARLHTRGFDPSIPWRIARWNERLSIIFFWFVMWGVIFPAMMFGGLWVIGGVVEGITTYNVERERCQKRAETPYEYAQCPR